jgi:hypothetical protein
MSGTIISRRFRLIILLLIYIYHLSCLDTVVAQKKDTLSSSSRDRIITLRRNNFDTYIHHPSHPVWILMFYSPWCGHWYVCMHVCMYVCSLCTFSFESRTNCCLDRLEWPLTLYLFFCLARYFPRFFLI